MTFKIINEAPEHVSRAFRLHLDDMIYLPKDTQDAISAVAASIRKDFELAARLHNLGVDSMTISQQLETSTDAKFNTLEAIEYHTYKFIDEIKAIRFDFIEAIA